MNVTISNHLGHWDVTSLVTNLAFRSIIPGGYSSASFTLLSGVDRTPSMVKTFSKVLITTNSGNVVWEGRLEDPGKTSSENSVGWEITAIGLSARANERVVNPIYIDQVVDRLVRSWLTSVKANTTTGENDADVPAIQISINEGASVSTSWVADMMYRYFQYAGMEVASIGFTHISGLSLAGFRIGCVTRLNSAAGTYYADQSWSTGATSFRAYNGSSGWVTGNNVVSVRAWRITSAVTANEDTWINAYGIVVRSILKAASGSNITTTSVYAVDYVTPGQIVSDLLGRYLTTTYDTANSTVHDSGIAITQSAYPDGAKIDDILDDVMSLDPDHYWAVWSSNPLTDGNPPFEYVQWPTEPRYQLNVQDTAFTANGSASNLYNSVAVRWVDSSGRPRITKRTQTLDTLTADEVNIVREDLIDLGDEIGSSAQAELAGDRFLAAHAYPTNNGTVTIKVPVFDLIEGVWKHPAEIRPGCVVEIVGVTGSEDPLNVLIPDGATRFRAVSTEFNEAAQAMTLELDSPAFTVRNSLRKIIKTRPRRR